MQEAGSHGAILRRGVPGRFLLVGSLCVMLLKFLPFNWLQTAVLCLPSRFLNIACPGCGLLRSGAAFLRGHWIESFRLYPLGPVLLTCLLFYIADEWRVWFQGGRSRAWVRPYVGSSLVSFGLVLIGLQWIAKLCGLW